MMNLYRFLLCTLFTIALPGISTATNSLQNSVDFKAFSNRQISHDEYHSTKDFIIVKSNSQQNNHGIVFDNKKPIGDKGLAGEFESHKKKHKRHRRNRSDDDDDDDDDDDNDDDEEDTCRDDDDDNNDDDDDDDDNDDDDDGDDDDDDSDDDSCNGTDINQAPQAIPQNLSILENQTLNIILTGNDFEGSPLSYQLSSSPNSGQLSGLAPNLIYLPNTNFSGTDQFSFIVNDGELNSAPALINIVVIPVNDPPEITSTPVITVDEGTSYNYDVNATDNDGDPLVYQLSAPPTGMEINPDSGLIQWLPQSSQTGNHTITVIVTDPSGASDTQQFTLTVNEIIKNPPTITSLPLLLATENQPYQYDVEAVDPDPGDVLTYSLLQFPDNMSIDSNTGMISWIPSDAYSLSLQNQHQLCFLEESQTSSKKFADIVLMVDESGSMAAEHNWIGTFVPTLEAKLKAKDVGHTVAENTYGLIGYGIGATDVRSIPMDNGNLTGNYQELISARANLGTIGGLEDGWLAIRYALDNYIPRPDSAINYILITDEDRDIIDNSLNYTALLNELQAKNIYLNVVVKSAFVCSDGREALGIDKHKRGYVADGIGGYDICPTINIIFGVGNTEAAYIDMALATGGAAWDIRKLREGGLTATSFTKALTTIKVREITEIIPSDPQADLTIGALDAVALLENTSSSVSLEIINRGPVASESSVLEFTAITDTTELPLGNTTIPSIPAGSTQLISFTIPQTGIWDTNTKALKVQIRSNSPGNLNDCNIQNNEALYPLVRLQVKDSTGLTDTQRYLISSQNENSAPIFANEPAVNAYVDIEYSYQPLITDDLGDYHVFELSGGPVDMNIDARTGLISYTSSAGQIGNYQITITVTDSFAVSTSKTFSLTVATPPANVYFPPRFSGVDGYQLSVGGILNEALAVNAHSDAVLSFTLVEGLAGMTLNPATGVLNWDVPLNPVNSVDVIIVRVTDQFGNEDIAGLVIEYISL